MQTKTLTQIKLSTVTGNTISGADADNYNLIQQSGLTADISKADLAVTGLTASDKVYDTNTTAALTGTAAITALTGDTVTLGGTATGVFADKNADTDKTVTVTGNTISGADADNYNLIQQSGLTADISKADLAVTGLTASDKVYDAGTAATLTGTATITALTGDTITLGGTATGSFDDKDVDTDKAVTVTGNTITGIDAGNYNLIQQSGLTADISKADLAVTGLTASDKVYDTNITASLSGTAAIAALGSDSVTISGTATGAFTDKNADTDKTVTVTGNTISGADADNYNLIQQSGLIADISTKQVTLSYNADDKIYDGTNTVNVNVSTEDIFENDMVSIEQTSLFADKNVGMDKLVNISGIMLSGVDSNNYMLNSELVVLTASIERLDSVIWVGGQEGNWFDPINWAGGAVPDASNVANVTIPEAITVNFDPENSATTTDSFIPVNVDSLVVEGNLIQSNGTLQVGAGGMSVNNFVQTGGQHSIEGTFTANTLEQSAGSIEAQQQFVVSESFNQNSDGTIIVAGSALIEDGNADTQIGNIQVENDLALSSDGEVTQAANTTIDVAGETVINAVSNDDERFDVTLTSATNDFQGGVTVASNNLDIVDINELNITLDVSENSTIVAGGDLFVTGETGTLTTTTSQGGSTEFGELSVAGDVIIISEGDVTQSGSISVNGIVNIDAGDNTVTLDDINNDFQAGVVINAQNVSIQGDNTTENSTVVSTGDAERMVATESPSPLNNALNPIIVAPLNLQSQDTDITLINITQESDLADVDLSTINDKVNIFVVNGGVSSPDIQLLNRPADAQNPLQSEPQD